MHEPEQIQEPQPTRAIFPLGQPRAAWVLLAINIALYVIPAILGMTAVVQDIGVKRNSAILTGEWYRLFSSMFLHASLTHIGFNAFALYSFGFDVERFYGTLRFLVVYFLAGLGGSAASYALSPNDGLGASGAIFGLIGALGAFFFQTRHIFGELSRQQLGSMVFITLINLGIGFTTPRIDNYAHIGGLVVGALAGLLLTPYLQVDYTRVPPLLIRKDRAYGWPGVLAMLLLIIAVVVFVQPPQFLP